MSLQAPRFAKLAELSQQTTSEGRRELLREVTEALSQSARPETDVSAFDQLLTAVASDYAAQVRADLAKLIAHNPQFACSAQLFALDEIEVAAPVLRHSKALSEETLIKVIEQKGQAHMMAVTARGDLSERVSHALVEKGDDRVVSSLLANDRARIGISTFEMVAQRAQESQLLQKPLVERKDVPIDLLNDLYMKVESGLRQQILKKFNHLTEAELDKAFRRSRERMSKRMGAIPDDMKPAKERIEVLSRRGELVPTVLVGLLREGKPGRTAFMVAFARLAGVEFDTVQRAVAAHDLDTVALLCRGSNFERALFITLAINLDGQDRGIDAAEEFGKIYEGVPVVAAQRALRFWKVRAAA